MEKKIFILAIESSCDDTSVAISCNDKILANVTANQKIHEQYGGVVPELASRDHQRNIIPVIDASLKKAKTTLQQIDAIAFTMGPGLMGSLLVGASLAKSLAWSLNIPLISVNHMQGHILAHFIKKTSETKTPSFPFLCLTVSGGHTQIVKLNNHFEFELLGETMDDAVGEAFDKAAKILGFPYPGGPLIDEYAKSGNPTAYVFPAAKVEGYNYSFSGIKTSFLYFIQTNVQKDANFIEKNLPTICASYQHHLIKTLLKKLINASNDTGIKEIAIAGGVSANSELRKQLTELGEKNHWSIFIPPFEYCTDNAAMIAIAGYYKFLRNDFSNLSIAPDVRMGI